MTRGKKVKTELDSSPYRPMSNASVRRGRRSSTVRGKSRCAAGKVGTKSKEVRPKNKDDEKSVTLKDGTSESGIKPKREILVSGISYPDNVKLKGKSSEGKGKESDEVKGNSFDSVNAVVSETKSQKKRRRLVKVCDN